MQWSSSVSLIIWSRLYHLSHLACTVTMIASYFSDRYRVRGAQYVIFGTISMIGYIMTLSAKPEQTNL